MRQANVYCRGVFAGVLTKGHAGVYRFQYAPGYLVDPRLPAISLSFPKREAPFESSILFPFFFGLMAEGEDKAFQCRALKIDEDDHFTRLLKTCEVETIGGVTVEEVASS
ncbi:HipA N-terminal domain-containing protein [Paludisphaera rhizosphaerae]|uniref:HipA N-terminal domain-containing protein n=1 Tax=Paludisphaera rhizosphaerae TaxID=2711216 RepID=UPI0013EC1291|nr:HipA N-terminal domain-containing protein [Paludisphaera rhizosphaerae]